MEDKNKLSDEVRHTPKKKGSGKILAEARKQQNRSVEEIADELNLSVTQIRTIELDQSEGLPEPTYVRGYIRSYAKLLGLDPTKVLDHYLNPNWQKGARLDEMPRGIGSANEVERGGFLTPAKTSALLAVTGVIGFLWFSGSFNGLIGEQDTEVVTAPEVSPSSSSTSTVPQEEISPGQQSDEVTEAGNGAGTDGDENTVPVTDSQVHQLTLNFSDTSWVDIRDAEGKRLAYKSYVEGETLEVSSATTMSVFIGNAKAVTAQYNGQDYDITPYREGVFARFSVGE